MSDAVVERVTRMISPLVADLKLDLYDVEYRGGVLRVTVDTPPGSPGGVDLDTIALLTRMIGRDFDHDDPMPGHYTLEVTSPGLERSLRVPAHWQREIGKTVNVRLRDVAAGERRLQGTLVAATDTDATLRLDDAELSERVVPYTQVDRAKTVFVWAAAPKPGKAPRRGATTGPSGRTASSASKNPSASKKPSASKNPSKQKNPSTSSTSDGRSSSTSTHTSDTEKQEAS